MKIIPAIDIINGQCVRLSEGDYSTKQVYYVNPLDAAKQFEDAGLEYLHLVDLDGAKAREVKNWDVLKSITANTSLKVDFSGGIKTSEAVERAFDLGVNQVTIGSLAAKNPELFISWIEKFGGDKIILGADVKEEFIATGGWLETTNKHIIDYLAFYIEKGITNVLCTDISKDGMLQGPSIDLYKKILAQFPDLNLIASGGVSGVQDLKDLVEINCGAVVIGKAIYENRIALDELKQF